MAIPQINIGSNSGPYWNVSQFIPLPSKTSGGVNLCLKAMKIVQRLHYVNRKLPVIYQHFNEPQSPQGYPYDLCALESEEVIYWIRKSVDEFIQIMYVGFCHKRDGIYPQKIRVDSIAQVI